MALSHATSLDCQSWKSEGMRLVHGSEGIAVRSVVIICVPPLYFWLAHLWQLKHPAGIDHPNIRAFMKGGWDCVRFPDGLAIIPKVRVVCKPMLGSVRFYVHVRPCMLPSARPSCLIEFRLPNRCRMTRTSPSGRKPFRAREIAPSSLPMLRRAATSHPYGM